MDAEAVGGAAVSCSHSRGRVGSTICTNPGGQLWISICGPRLTLSLPSINLFEYDSRCAGKDVRFIKILECRATMGRQHTVEHPQVLRNCLQTWGRGGQKCMALFVCVSKTLEDDVLTVRGLWGRVGFLLFLQMEVWSKTACILKCTLRVAEDSEKTQGKQLVSWFSS